MKFVIILIILYFVVWLLLPWLKRLIGPWLARRAQKMMMNRMEDMMRSASGMPPRDRKEERRQQKRREREEKSASGRWHEAAPRQHYRRADEPIIPKEYAVDVEYTEYKEYSQQTVIKDRGDRIEFLQQEQVSDVEWVEIKDK